MSELLGHPEEGGTGTASGTPSDVSQGRGSGGYMGWQAEGCSRVRSKAQKDGGGAPVPHRDLLGSSCCSVQPEPRRPTQGLHSAALAHRTGPAAADQVKLWLHRRRTLLFPHSTPRHSPCWALRPNAKSQRQGRQGHPVQVQMSSGVAQVGAHERTHAGPHGHPRASRQVPERGSRDRWPEPQRRGHTTKAMSTEPAPPLLSLRSLCQEGGRHSAWEEMQPT